MILHVALDRVPISVSACMIVATVANDTAASIANNVNVAFPANDKAVAVATLSNADVAVDASANNTAANDAFPVNGEAADAAIMSNTDMAADAVASPANDAAAEIANAANVVICIVSISVLFVFDLPFVVIENNSDTAARAMHRTETCLENIVADAAYTIDTSTADADNDAGSAVLAIALLFAMPAPILYTDPSFCFVSSPSQTEVLFKMNNQNLDIKVSSLSQMEIWTNE